MVGLIAAGICSNDWLVGTITPSSTLAIRRQTYSK
jgi:hypothetical protein